MSGMNDKLLTEYMVGRMRQGFDYLVMYLAATLFERLMCQKLLQADPNKYENITQDKKDNTLYNILQALRELKPAKYRCVEFLYSEHEFFPVTTKNNAWRRIDRYRRLRNQIIHCKDIESLIEDEQFKGQIVELILYLTAENCPDLFKNQFKCLKDSKFVTREMFRGALDAKEADYLVRSIDEVMIKRYDQKVEKSDEKWEIEEFDFSNLFHLRHKLVPLKNSLDLWLETNYRKLETTILTTIDTSSAYIWLPIVHKDNAPQDADRPNLESATVSILATPTDIRFYIDFGGFCYDGRKEYFNFIKDPKGPFRTFLQGLESEDAESFRVFDIEWYSFITKTRKPASILKNWSSWEKVVNKAESDLGLLKKDPIITRNKLLSGFIYDRNWIRKNGPLNEDFFHDKLSQIIDLYYNLLLDKQFEAEG